LWLFGKLQLSNSAQIWRYLGHKFGKLGYAVWGRMLVKLEGNFFTECCLPATFCLVKIFGEIDAKGQFHQHFISALATIFLRKKSSDLKCTYKKALQETFE
jgi:hypothetical protein